MFFPIAGANFKLPVVSPLSFILHTISPSSFFPYFLHIHFLFSSFPSPLPLSALPTMIGCRRNKAYVFIAYIAPESFFVQLLSEFWN